MTRASLNRQINSLLVNVGEANGLAMDAPASTLIATAMLSIALDRVQPEIVRAATAGSKPPVAVRIADEPIADPAAA